MGEQGVQDAEEWVYERAREVGERAGYELAEGFKAFDLREEDVD